MIQRLMLCFCLSVLLGEFIFAAPTADRPNILLIVADDLGYADLGVYGGDIKTPAIDNVQLRSQKNTHLKMGAKRNSLAKEINKWACSIREASVSKPVFR